MARKMDKRFLESVELSQNETKLQVFHNSFQYQDPIPFTFRNDITHLAETVWGFRGWGGVGDYFELYKTFGIPVTTDNISETIPVFRFKIGDYYLVAMLNTTYYTFALVLTNINREFEYSNNTEFSYTIETIGGNPDLIRQYKYVFFVSLAKFEQRTHLCFGTVSRVDEMPSDASVNALCFDINELKKIGDIEFIIQSDRYGTYSTNDGYSGGSFDTSSDAIGVPELPRLGVSTTGFINIYSPSINELVNFGDDLFPNFDNATFPDLTGDVGLREIGEAVGALVNNVYNIGQSFINSKLIDYVIDCHIIPCYPTVGSKEKIKVGFKTFNQESLKVTSDYVSVDCGSLSIAEYYNNFIDYVGTEAKLYLPFVGFVGLEPEFFQNGTIKVVYSFNIVDGSFMVHVLSTSSKSNLKDTVIGSYSGNCCVHIPITGLNYSTLVTSVLNGTGATVSNLMSGNVIGAVDNALNTLSSKPSMQNSNGYSSSSAFLGIRKPYLLISRIVSSFSNNYTQENGLPLNVSKTLNEMDGLTVVKNAILDGLSCTSKEKEMIKNMLEKGVIL